MHEIAFPLLVGLIALALAFDFLNGLHDAANSIATVVSTRLLSPVQAVLWTKASVQCYRSKVAANLVAFGANDRADYCEAKRLGLDAVMVDSPEKMAGIRTQVETNPASCNQ